MSEELDNIHDFESRNTAKKLPFGWQLLFWGLILWGIYYVATYTPFLSGWSQEQEYVNSIKK